MPNNPRGGDMEKSDWIDNVTTRRALYIAFANGWSSYLTAVGCGAPWDPWTKPRQGSGYRATPLWVWLVSATISAPLFAFVQGYGAWWAMRPSSPTWPMDWAFHAHYALEFWLDRFCTSFTWLRPDSGDPHEVGFHARADQLTYERDADGLRQIVNRPRCYWYESATAPPATEGTWTSGSPITYVMTVTL